ncbi:MAG: aminoglycoside phosphotransferase family protein [Proteobacteria bacterium]|nr:aminoglycoside phosphotransferase family protein [Pseudomonadota bacterium]
MGEKVTADIHAVAAQFFAATAIQDIREYGTGRVNDTFLVTVAGMKEKRFILQRISSAVFAHPEWIMENLRIVCDHVVSKLAAEGNTGNWRMPLIQQTLWGRDFYRDRDESCWRVLHFIADCRSFTTVQSRFQAREAGLALGRFHRLINDLDPALLHDTLPGFHVTPLYFAQYDRVAATSDQPSSADIRFCHDFITRRRALAHVLEDAGKEGKLFNRPIHGDPKLSNILFDEQTGRAVSLIDLDTVKPGLIQYDIGDCLRSCCNGQGEEGPLPVFFDTELCREILQGYVAEAGSFLTSQDYEYFYAGTRLIAFELGLRFFTDYLQGNVYFKASSPGQNLERSLVQFSLTESIEKQEREIGLIICDIT